jgi:hypothetical protein
VQFLRYCSAITLALLSNLALAADKPAWAPVSESDAQVMFDHAHFGMSVDRRSRWFIDYDHSMELARFSGGGRRATVFADLLNPGAGLYWVETQANPLTNRLKLFESARTPVGTIRKMQNHIGPVEVLDFTAPGNQSCVLIRLYSGEEDDIGAGDPLGYTKMESSFCSGVDGPTLPPSLVNDFLHAVGLHYAQKPPRKAAYSLKSSTAGSAPVTPRSAPEPKSAATTTLAKAAPSPGKATYKGGLTASVACEVFEVDDVQVEITVVETAASGSYEQWPGTFRARTSTIEQIQVTGTQVSFEASLVNRSNTDTRPFSFRGEISATQISGAWNNDDARGAGCQGSFRLSRQ